YAPLRARQHPADVQSPGRRLGKIARRRGGRHGHARSPSPSWSCAQVRSAELANQSSRHDCGRRSMTIPPHCLAGARSNRKKAFLDGDSVPMPLGFTAFPPEWLVFFGRLAPPPPFGRRVGAPVASPPCPTLLPGQRGIRR